MGTKVHKSDRPHYYIKEHMERLGVSDEVMGVRLGIGREAVWKRYTEQKRLDPRKIAAFADALDMHHTELLYPPGIPSLDAIAEKATPEQRAMAADVLRRMLEKPS